MDEPASARPAPGRRAGLQRRARAAMPADRRPAAVASRRRTSPRRSALPEGALDFNAARAAMPADRLARAVASRAATWPPISIRAAPQARQAGHPHARQPVHRLAAVQNAGPGDGSSTAIRCSTWPAPLRCRPASPPSSPRRSCCATARCCAITGAGRAPSRHLAAGRADHPGGAGRGAAGRRGHFLAALLPHWRRCRPNWPRASSGNSACTSTKAWA